MLRIATVNVNGIRAAHNKTRGQSAGLSEWLAARDVDVVTLQEVRAPDEIVHQILADTGYHVVHSEAAAKGRAGVAVLSRTPPTAHRVGNGDEFFDDSGRWIEADIPLADGSMLTVVSAYVHSGEAGTPRQEEKYRFLDQMVVRLAEIRATGAHAVVTGDLNVAHTERDIKNWKANRKKAGFLPEERAYFDRFMGELGWVDVHRSLAGDVDGPYTWWSMRGKAFDTDAGWRIDYQLATPELAATARLATVDRAISWAERWSDHAPLVIDYDL
ncbi:exodeoxyribonuclease III [Aeromicrobium chenweiae]|uniref:Exodeoxyribonuclease III n=1 Tax=Aeromicrobium chenweiae TaxID=2079793 RepID=A0A2S0WMW2_9ACTN|nr:exodeoxyribonuclease III [Aeromicrobium chenweiae]AWB92646.1 exodeoxyribonuclease III [Aeromicrobium chenweiae]TGN33634.1 exodeoxyribonuclease III [Aeromicrobium chenweiae]